MAGRTRRLRECRLRGGTAYNEDDATRLTQSLPSDLTINPPFRVVRTERPLSSAGESGDGEREAVGGPSYAAVYARTRPAIRRWRRVGSRTFGATSVLPEGKSMRLSIAFIALVIGFSLAGCFAHPNVAASGRVSIFAQTAGPRWQTLW